MFRVRTDDSFLERWFGLKVRGTSVRIEAFAGATTFMAAAYLVVVIPGILAGGGMDLAAVTTATIVMFFVGTLGMALYANLPFVVGPGLGGAAIVATTLAVTEGVPWQTGMAIAFWSGVLFLLLTLLGMREVVSQLIPVPIKLGLSAALGGFVAMLGFRNAGMVVANPRVNALVLGDFSSHGAIVTLIGLAVAIALRHRKIPGAILLAIILGHADRSSAWCDEIARKLFRAAAWNGSGGVQVTSVGSPETRRFSRIYSHFLRRNFSPPWALLWPWATKRACSTSTAICPGSTGRLWLIHAQRRSDRSSVSRR